MLVIGGNGLWVGGILAQVIVMDLMIGKQVISFVNAMFHLLRLLQLTV
jgi:hypothetical protein